MAEFDNVKLDSKIEKVKSGGNLVDLIINDSAIEWKFHESESKLKSKERTVEWKDVVGCETKLYNKKNCIDDASRYLTIYYISILKDRKWRCDHISFEGDFLDLISTIENRIKLGKPRNLLVIINPIGGFGRARQTYDKQVAPLFKMAGIIADVTVTERPNHAYEIGKSVDETKYDGIALVGGDGLYHEVLNGLIIKTQEDNNIDYNDVNSQLVSPTLPIGLIPAGTGNGIAGYSCGVVDVETSVLHIIKGEHHKACVIDINVKGQHVIYGGLLFGYGYFSDLIKKAEDRRWMKVFRYPVSIVGSFIGRVRTFRGELKYKTMDNISDNIESEWKTVDLKEFQSISSFCCNVDLKSEGEKMKISMQQPTGSFMAYPRAPKLQSLKSIARFALQDKTFADFEWLTFKQGVSRLHIKVDQSECNDYTQQDKDLELFINVDGESLPLDEPEVEVRFCSQLQPLFSTSFAF